jgi:hypothetical protein
MSRNWRSPCRRSSKWSRGGRGYRRVGVGVGVVAGAGVPGDEQRARLRERRGGGRIRHGSEEEDDEKLRQAEKQLSTLMASALHFERLMRDANAVMKEKYQNKFDEVRAR